MLKPTYDKLRRRMSDDGPRIIFASGPLGPSGNPRHRKYYWQVFSLESPLEGGEFLLHGPVLHTAQFEAEIARLQARGQSCLVYGWSRPRLDPNNPFDPNSKKWKEVEFAPSWDDDADPAAEGGHK